MSGWKHDWSRLVQGDPWIGVALVETLIYYDGPQLVLFRTPDADRIGIVVDHCAFVERWVVAPFGPVEFAASVAGGPMRDVFTKPGRLDVVDTMGLTGDRPIWKVLNQHRIAVEHVPDGELPVPGARFPDRVIEYFRDREADFDAWAVP